MMLIAAMNPCQCGYLGDAQRTGTCTVAQVQRYRSRVSGPLLDRIDIQVEVRPVAYSDLAGQAPAESSAAIRSRVCRARQVQLEGFRSRPLFRNAQMAARDLHHYCGVEPAAPALARPGDGEARPQRPRLHAYIKGSAHHRRPDDSARRIAPGHVAEAIQYRSLDRALR